MARFTIVVMAMVGKPLNKLCSLYPLPEMAMGGLGPRAS